METLIGSFVFIVVVTAFMGYMRWDYCKSKKSWLKLVEIERQ